MTSFANLPDDRDRELDCTALDAALGACDRAAEDALRARATEDPALMFQLAEEVAFLERCRELTVTPSARYGAMLRDVTRRAERRVPRHVPLLQRPWFVVAAAAAVTFAALAWSDPLSHRRADAPGSGMKLAIAVEGGSGDEVSGEAGTAQVHTQSSFASAVEAMRDRFEVEGSGQLREALTSALSPDRDRLGRWLDPRNTVALMRLDHEVRARSEVREQALRSQGGLAAADRRVQQFADDLARELPRRFRAVPFEPEPALAEVAWVVRALLAAGPTSAQRAEAVAAGSQWLADRLEVATVADSVAALSALIEVAAVSGQHVAAVSSQGRRLLEDVLSPADAWRRGRPDLLAAAVSPAVVGEAMRVFRQLPAFGLDAERCELIRNLLLGSLRERIDRGADGPECFAALVYGGSDLLDELERYSCERHLRRWQPVSLAPDFVTVQQLAWGMEPGRSGYTRLQWQLRPLAALPRPQSMQAQAALTVCLAASYAAPRGEFLQEVARATLGLGD
ncbi:MAG: hypothetical protein H6838_17145 [Planctomycetes bacterium]|nr:hypothetical protein [Planctomycetota bacterium]MCB9887220.1 hypothetical protein [Planctomycetota bacterium]